MRRNQRGAWQRMEAREKGREKREKGVMGKMIREAGKPKSKEG